MTLYAFLFVPLLAGQRPVPALGKHSAMLSPDHRYYAMTVHGEADCQYLIVVKVDPKNVGGKILAGLRKDAEAHSSNLNGVPKPPHTVLDRMDAESFLWIPGNPHKLVFGESDIYGEGIVGVWDGQGKYRVIDRPKTSEFVIRLVSYAPNDHRLLYEVSTTKHQKIRTTRHSVRVD